MMQYVTVCLLIFTVSLNAAFAGAQNSQTADTPSVNIQTVKILDLYTAQKIAIAENPSLEAAKLRLEQATERLQQASAAYYPTLDLTASISRVRLSDNAYQLIAATGQDNPADYYNGGLSIRWLVFNGFKRHYTYKGAQWNEMEYRQAHRDVLRQLMGNVARAYFRAQLQHQNLAIIAADIDFNRRQLEDAQARLRIGAGSLSDVLNFQVQMNAARSDMNGVRLNYARARHALAALMGFGEEYLPAELELAHLPSITAMELDPVDAEQWIEYALVHRPDVIQAAYTMQRAHAGIGTAKASFFPMIALSGSLNSEREDSINLADDDYFGDSIALNLSYNLFSGGADQARLKEAKLQLKEAERNMETIKLTVVSEVRDALSELQSSQDEFQLQKDNANLVQQNRDLVEKEYAAGESSLVRLNEAQRDLIRAQSRLALALVALHQARNNLKITTGQILDEL